MSQQYQIAPVRVTVAALPEEKPSIQQFVIYEPDEEQKIETLLRIFKEYQPTAAIVFCNLKVSVAAIVESLTRHLYSAEGLQGDLEQRDRDLVMAKFRNGSTRILVATDVAARGIDIEDLSMVINFDLPHQPDDYVHRIGRTGRAGRKGIAISIAAPRDRLRIKEYEEYNGAPIEQSTSTTIKPSEELPPAPRAAGMQTLYISGGRKEKVRPGDILGALTGEAGGFNGSDIGKIEIHDHFSYVAVSANIAEKACKCLSDGKIKGQKFLIRLMK